MSVLIYKRSLNRIRRRTSVSRGTREIGPRFATRSPGTIAGCEENRRIVYDASALSTRAMNDSEDTVFMLPGPVKMHPRVLRAMAAPALNHRGPEFKEILTDPRSHVQYPFGPQ